MSRVTYSSFVSDYDAAMDGMDGVDLDEAMADLDLDDKDDADDAGGKANTTMLWDMTRPLVGHVSKIEFLKFEDDQDARTAFWHSSAHVLGEALERLYGSRLTVGPPLAGGFYYDSYMGDGGADGTLKEDDCEFCLRSFFAHHFSFRQVPLPFEAVSLVARKNELIDPPVVRRP